MVTNRFGGAVMLFSAANGSLVNPNFINFNATGSPWSYPVEPIQVGNEIWVTDILSGLHRFSIDGSTYLGDIGHGVLNYTLGFEVVDGIAYVPIDYGAQAGTVVMLDRDSNLVGSFVVGGWNSDILRRGDELLIHHSDTSGSSILKYSLTGTFLGTFSCAGCPRPINITGLALHPDGGVLAADSHYPGGIYRYSSTGAFVASYLQFDSLWGLHMLDDGRVMYATRKGDGAAGAFDLTTGGLSVYANGLDAFGVGLLVVPSPCYANCDHSVAPPVLNANDFQCFLNAFAAGESYANCDHSTSPPILNVNDFQCFLNKYAAGCS